MTAQTTMAAWGIQAPDQVIDRAAATGLSLPVACALLDQESGGGRNVWGHDGVETGGLYVKGGLVTRAAYEAYRTAVKAGRIGRQGVGPCQLTSAGYQDAGDAAGGCWDPRANMHAGFSGLAALIRQYGLPDGVRRYNGSGPAAEAYRDRMLGRIRAWTDRLGPLATVTKAWTTGDDDMQPDERAALMEIRDGLRNSGIGKGRLPGRSPRTGGTVDDAFGWILSGAAYADETADAVDELRTAVSDLAKRIPALPADWPALLAQALIAHVTGGKTP